MHIIWLSLTLSNIKKRVQKLLPPHFVGGGKAPSCSNDARGGDEWCYTMAARQEHVLPTREGDFVAIETSAGNPHLPPSSLLIWKMMPTLVCPFWEICTESIVTDKLPESDTKENLLSPKFNATEIRMLIPNRIAELHSTIFFFFPLLLSRSD